MESVLGGVLGEILLVEYVVLRFCCGVFVVESLLWGLIRGLLVV